MLWHKRQPESVWRLESRLNCPRLPANMADCLRNLIFLRLVARLGLEPRQTDPESAFHIVVTCWRANYCEMSRTEMPGMRRGFEHLPGAISAVYGHSLPPLCHAKDATGFIRETMFLDSRARQVREQARGRCGAGQRKYPGASSGNELTAKGAGLYVSRAYNMRGIYFESDVFQPR